MRLRTRNLRPAEVAALFDVKPNSIRRWVDRGLLNPTRTKGGHSRFSVIEVRRLLAAGVPDARRSDGVRPVRRAMPVNTKPAFDLEDTGAL